MIYSKKYIMKMTNTGNTGNTGHNVQVDNIDLIQTNRSTILIGNQILFNTCHKIHLFLNYTLIKRFIRKLVVICYSLSTDLFIWL